MNKFIDMVQNDKTAQARGYQKLGDIMVLKNNLDEAKKNYKKAIEIKPNYAGVYNSLGMLFVALKNFDEAIINLKN